MLERHGLQSRNPNPNFSSGLVACTSEGVMLYPLELLCEKIAGDWEEGDSEKESCVRKTEYVNTNTFSHYFFS